ncbi:MAG: DUF1207 domain-containing protein [bacterium]|nr:DUF1207 domain-containing protein [bacterium]
MNPGLYGVVFILLLSFSSPGLAQQGEVEANRTPSESGRTLLLFPSGYLVRPFIADPHRPGSGLLVESYTSTDIEQAGDRRFYLKLGGRFGILRRLPKTPKGRMWQLSLEAGLDAQFDSRSGQDNTGWDGNYGLTLTTARKDGKWAYKTGMLHTSAHIGDEWIQRTGRERVNYTREEALGAVSWQFAPRWRTYLETGWGYELRAKDGSMEPLRTQAGFEFESPRTRWKMLSGWYAATDISSWEERDWRTDVSIQAGVKVVSDGRTWRLGIQYYDGRVPLGEFFKETESAFTIGLWAEL